MITVAEIAEFTAQAKQFPPYDNRVSAMIAKIDGDLRSAKTKLVQAIITTGVKLAWSGAKGYWKFVIVDDEEAIELLQATWEERLEAFTSGAMGKLISQVVAAPSKSVRSAR
jgi:hypothetical protein